MSTATRVDRRTAAHALEQIAELLELRGESAYRIRSFRAAARAVDALSGDLAAALEDGSLAEARGVGPATLAIVQELASTGRSGMLDELRELVPPGLVEMLRIGGLGVTRIRQIHDTLDIDSLPELEAAARDGRLAALPRFGPRTAENVLRGIRFLRQADAVRLGPHAATEAQGIAGTLAAMPGVRDVTVAGELRRGLGVVHALVLVVTADAPPAEVFARIRQLPGVDEIAGEDEREATMRLAGGGTARVIATLPANRGAVLVHATGSDEHLRLLGARARERGLALTGAALWRGSTFVPTPDEAALYAALGLPWVPPELREGGDEVTQAAGGTLPRLVDQTDLRGLLHCHTSYSDGTSSVRDLALACRAAGYSYVGITDHSAGARYSGGLTPDALRRQADEIDEVNATVDGIRVLKGVEADILQDGTIEYGEAVLAQLDFVIASVHTRFGMGAAEMTQRLCSAVAQPFVTIIGHPTGRLLLQREPYAFDFDVVAEAAAQHGVALEINADPHRLDLDWQAARAARDAGVRLSIGADAHSPQGLENVAWGVAMARKAGLVAADVLNTRTADEFVALAARRRA